MREKLFRQPMILGHVELESRSLSRKLRRSVSSDHPSDLMAGFVAGR